MPITPGSLVESPKGRKSTVGPLILSEGSWYTFVPGYCFVGETKVMEAGTGLLVGEIVSKPLSAAADDRCDITEAMRLVRLFSYVPVWEGNHRGIRCVDPLDFLGEEVRKRDGISTITGHMVSLDGPFALETSDGVKTYFGAFGIEPEHDDIVFAKTGDAGASILSPDGDFIGVLFGIADTTYYCVPGDALIARYFPGLDRLEVVA
jgi:hypothetical protein